jgi:phage terminase large subunit-like protein
MSPRTPRRTKAATHVVDAYAIDVVKGRVPAGKYHRLACERHLRDRDREGTAAFPYVFTLAKANRFFRFASRLKHYKGEWAGQFIVLQPWQQFRLGSIFGWVHMHTGLRRFRRAYNEIPRKNGKTLEAAIVALYVTFFDGEPGAEGYTLATMRHQAMFVFNDAKKLVRQSGLRTRITIRAKNLHSVATSSKLEPLGKDPEDGLNPNLIIVDEFHKIKHRDQIDVMETATGARRQPLDFQITTAGDDERSPCGTQHHYACQILEQALDPPDETTFAFIAHADIEDKERGIPADDWTLETTWRKANPNYGVSVKPDDLRNLVTKAQHMPDAAAGVQQKRLNIWVNTDAPWLSMEGWRRGQSSWSATELVGQVCYASVDLASKIDLAALALAFPPTLTRKSWRFLVRHFTPADTLIARGRRDRVPYTLWTQRIIPGTEWPYLTTNPGQRLDQDVVRAAVNDAKAFGFLIQQVGFDEWNANNIEQDLMADEFDVVAVPQSVKSLSPPSKEFEADVLDGLVHCGGDPIMLWEASNVVVFRDGPENIKPVKKKSRGKIDGIVAAIMARKLAALEDGAGAEDPVLVSA